MAEISIEERTEQSKNIVAYFLHKIEKDKLDAEQQIKLVYNDAIRDAVEAMDTYIKENPRYASAFQLLKDELQWMPLVGVGDNANSKK